MARARLAPVRTFNVRLFEADTIRGLSSVDRGGFDGSEDPYIAYENVLPVLSLMFPLTTDFVLS
jgi:hypothetical protein